MIGANDAAVVRDIYAIVGEDGSRDTAIEDLLLKGVDGAFCGVRELLVAHQEVRYWQWRDLSRFLALQIARTPRQFQSIRDEYASFGVNADQNDPQKAMVLAAPRLENWICWMEWAICRNESDFPFLTSDNPVVFWVDRGKGAEGGVGFAEPALQIFFPVSPRLCFTARHSQTSCSAALADPANREASFLQEFDLNIVEGKLDATQVKRANLLMVGNADKCVYSNSNDEALGRFLKRRFIGRIAPVRRRDRCPFGSPIQSLRDQP